MSIIARERTAGSAGRGVLVAQNYNTNDGGLLLSSLMSKAPVKFCGHSGHFDFLLDPASTHTAEAYAVIFTEMVEIEMTASNQTLRHVLPSRCETVFNPHMTLAQTLKFLFHTF